MAHIKGRFEYVDPSKSDKDERKKAEKRKLKEMMEADKAMKKQCLCNHRDRKKDKTHFDMSDDGLYRICKICGGKILRDPEDLSEDKINAAAEIIYSVLSIVRTSYDLDISEKFDDKITSALEVVMACPKLVNELKNVHVDSLKKHKKDKKKKKKNHDNDYGSYYRVMY